MADKNKIDLTNQVAGALPAANAGVPAGGTTGQVLTKHSNADYDSDWETPAAGSGTVTHASGALAAHQVVLGNGGADVETPVAIGTAGQYLRSAGAGADPAFATPTPAEVGLGNVTNDAQLKASQLDTDGTLAANSDTRVASQKAVKTYVDAFAPGGSGALTLKTNGTANGSQSLLNLKDGNGIEVTDDGLGGITIKDKPLTTWSPWPTSGSISVGTINVVRLAHFVITKTVSFNKIGVANVLADASNKYSFGIFSMDGATRYAHTTEQVMSGSNTFRALSVAEGTVVLPPGDYLFAWTGQALTASFLTFVTFGGQLTPTNSSTTTSGGVMPAAPISIPTLAPTLNETSVVAFMLYT